VVVVVASSPDGTATLAKAKAKLFKRFRVVPAGPRAGKGRDVRTGIMEAAGNYRLFMDADLATPLHHIATVKQLITAEKVAERPEVIIGVRDLSTSHTGFGKLLRKLVSSVGNWLLQLLLLPGITDTQCGFKAFSTVASHELFGRQKILGWGFDMEILAIARQRHYRIAQIPIDDWQDQPSGAFDGRLDVAILRAAVITLGELMVIIWRRWTGGYRHISFTYKEYRP
jgi:dolichyl-phosphate beta-glucosyltransferase